MLLFMDAVGQGSAAMANAGNMTMLLHKVEALCALYADEDAVSEEWARRLAEIDRLLKAVRQEQRREQSAKTDQSARFEAWQARREEEGKLKQEMLDRRYQAIGLRSSSYGHLLATHQGRRRLLGICDARQGRVGCWRPHRAPARA